MYTSSSPTADSATLLAASSTDDPKLTLLGRFVGLVSGVGVAVLFPEDKALAADAFIGRGEAECRMRSALSPRARRRVCRPTLGELPPALFGVEVGVGDPGDFVGVALRVRCTSGDLASCSGSEAGCREPTAVAAAVAAAAAGFVEASPILAAVVVGPPGVGPAVSAA